MGVPEDVTSVEDYYADQANWPEEIEQISKVLLEQLMADSTYASALITPEYQSRSEDEYFKYYPEKTRANASYFFTYMDDQGYQLDWEFLCRLAKANGIEDFDYAYYQSNAYDIQRGKLPCTMQELVDKLTTVRETVYKYQKDEAGNIIYETAADGTQTPVFALDSEGQKIVDYHVSGLINPDYYNKNNPKHTDKLNAVYRHYHKYTGTLDTSLSFTEQFFAAMNVILREKDYGIAERDWDLFARLTEVNCGAIKTALDNGYYCASYSDIAAKEIEDTLYVAAVYESEGVSYCTGVIDYSLANYCNEKAVDDASAMQDLAKATAVYSYYASAYFTED